HEDTHGVPSAIFDTVTICPRELAGNKMELVGPNLYVNVHLLQELDDVVDLNLHVVVAPLGVEIALGEQPASQRPQEPPKPAEGTVPPSPIPPIVAPVASSPAPKPLVAASFRVSPDILQAFDDLAYELRHKKKRELFDEALCDLIAKYRGSRPSQG
ncbi:MAG: hypothetical protein AAF658_19330, partial [Myxococcota bacterium]